MPAPIFKHVSADQVVPLGFAQAATGIAAITATPRGLVPGAGPIGAAGAVDAGKILVTLSGGTDGERYDVEVHANHAGVAPTSREFSVAVLDGSWAMADGEAGWLTIVEFADHFGLDELIGASDRDGSGTIDRSFVIQRLRGAQGEAAINLAERYALPLSAVPDVLKTIVADLAAVRFYDRDLPEGRAQTAKAARDTLKRIAEGKLPLPGVAGVAVPAAAVSDAPIIHTGGDRAYPDNLAGY